MATKSTVSATNGLGDYGVARYVGEAHQRVMSWHRTELAAKRAAGKMRREMREQGRHVGTIGVVTWADAMAHQAEEIAVNEPGRPVTTGRGSEGSSAILVRVNAEERAALDAAAKRAEMSTPAWLRGLGMSVARG